METARVETKPRPCTFAVRPLSTALGAEIIGVDLSRELDEPMFPQIRDAWHQNLVILLRGQKLSEGTAAWLRHEGIDAETLEGGFEAWKKAGEPLVRADKLPPRDGKGRTVWVTRSRPKVDRIACPWLIRRFVDPGAVFLFVAPPEVKMVAERFGGTAFDIEDTFWSHRGPKCTFDTMVEEFALASEPMYQGEPIVAVAAVDELTATEAIERIKVEYEPLPFVVDPMVTLRDE